MAYASGFVRDAKAKVVWTSRRCLQRRKLLPNVLQPGHRLSMDDLEDVTEEFRTSREWPARKSVGLRVRADYLEAIKAAVARRGIPYQTLVQTWLIEKLRQEAPDLLPAGQVT